MSSRDLVLGRIAQALRDVPETEQPEHVFIPRSYRASHAGGADLVELFIERTRDYGATVVHVQAEDLPGAVAAAIGTENIMVPAGFPTELLPAPVSNDTPGHSGTVITLARTGIAVTGTIILDTGPGQGTRASTLLPDRHICVLYATQIAADVTDGLAALNPKAPITMISGPSATSDIELSRVEGVHGPRTLHIIVADDRPREHE